MRLGKPDARGRRTPVPVEGSNFLLECDTAVIAIGYNVDDEIARTAENLKTTKWGTPAQARYYVNGLGHPIRPGELC